MRRRDKVLISLIATWQGLLALIWFTFWIIKINATGLSELTYISTYLISEEIIDIGKFCGLVLVPIAVSGCAGLVLRREWGRWLSIITMILMLPTITGFYISVFAPGTKYVWETIVVLLIILAGYSTFILPIVYLTRSYVKNIFRASKKTDSGHRSILLWAAPAIPIILLALSFVFYQVSAIIAENKHQAELKQKVEQSWTDLKKNRELWENAAMDDYNFSIRIGAGGTTYWEGFGGMSHGGILLADCRIEVRDNKAVSITRANELEPNMTVVERADTIPELFDLISQTNQGVTIDTVKTLTGIQDFELNVVEPSLFNNISVEYNSVFGYPTKISIYHKKGQGEVYTINHLVGYEVFDFVQILDDEYKSK